MARHGRYLVRAATVASQSDCRYMLGAVVVRGGSILAVSANKYRNSPSVVEYGDSSIHAEVAALRPVGQPKGRNYLCGATQ